LGTKPKKKKKKKEKRKHTETTNYTLKSITKNKLKGNIYEKYKYKNIEITLFEINLKHTNQKKG